jgi:small-conductance mechanosensitive channel
MPPTSTATVIAAPTGQPADWFAPIALTLVAVFIVAIVALVMARAARAATLRALAGTRADLSLRHSVARYVFVSVLILGTLTIMSLVGVPWTTVVALTGVIGLAASLALQDVLKNVVAGIYLSVERPFRVGDSLKVREHAGRVESLALRTTQLRDADGALILVPNAVLFAEIVMNTSSIVPVPAAPGGDDAASP